MGAGKRERLPKDLAQGVRRFRAWRGRRKAGSRIPEPLWAIAVRLAAVHGVSRTASVLGLEYYALKRRAQASGELPARSQAFVELPAPVAVGQQCLFELAGGAGNTLRVQLLGYDAADVATVARSFWSGE
jgi:hypothetical protein